MHQDSAAKFSCTFELPEVLVKMQILVSNSKAVAEIWIFAKLQVNSIYDDGPWAHFKQQDTRVLYRSNILKFYEIILDPGWMLWYAQG